VLKPSPGACALPPLPLTGGYEPRGKGLLRPHQASLHQNGDLSRRGPASEASAMA
jgi:hypothetical protein